MLAECRSGISTLADGTVSPARVSRVGSLITGCGQGDYYEQASRGNIFNLVLATTSSTIAAGNINAAASGASTQFAVWNPLGSGKNLALLKFWILPISGTAPLAGCFHSYSSTAPTIATSVVSPITCSNIGMAAASVARALTSAAGAALTGSTALQLIRPAHLYLAAGAMGTTGGFGTNIAEELGGSIVIPPGTCWVPTWTAAGTSFLNGYGVMWEEIAI
jgi:hypothetical protein